MKLAPLLIALGVILAPSGPATAEMIELVPATDITLHGESSQARIVVPTTMSLPERRAARTQPAGRWLHAVCFGSM